MLNFDRSVVKHGTQNIQNYCHQWLSDSFIVHRIRLRPGPHWGSLQRSSRPSSWFKGSYFYKGEERGGREEREKGRGRGREEPAHLSQICGSSPEYGRRHLYFQLLS